MEISYAALAFNENLKRDPNIMDHITNPEALTKQLADSAKERVALNATNEANRPSEPRKEFNRLRKELFDAQEWARNAEVYCNEWAGKVKLLEQRITDLLKQKKAAVEAGNLRGERTYENQIQLLEDEVLATRAEFNRAKIQSGDAGRGLKGFRGHARIAELKTILEVA